MNFSKHVTCANEQVTCWHKIRRNWSLFCLTSEISYYGLKTSTLKQDTNLEIMLYGFHGLSKHITLNFRNDNFGPYKIQYYSLNNIVLLVTIDKFNPNPTLVNNNKLKPYRVMEHHTLQLVLTKPSDFLSKEPIETTHSSNLFIDQLIETIHSSNLFTKELVKRQTIMVTCLLRI